VRDLPLRTLIRRAEARGYRAGTVHGLLLEIERWWSRAAAAEVEALLAEARREFERGRRMIAADLDLETPAREAMMAMMAVGAWSAYKERRARYAGKRGVRGKWARMADGEDREDWPEPEDIDPMRDVDPEARFPEAMAETYGIPRETVDAYVETRMPPIRHASEEVRARVRDAVAAAVRRGWSPEELRDDLRGIGNWAQARLNNQVRTESATMFNAGRAMHFMADEAIVGYRYLVTLDDRTTPLCAGMADRVYRTADLPWLPPGHYSCRTVLEPIFAWEDVEFDDDEPLMPDEFGFEGFGQPDLTEEVRGRAAQRQVA